MKKREWNKQLRDAWLQMTIKKKISLFTFIVFFIILLLVFFDVWVVQFTMGDFRSALEDNVRSSDYMGAMEAESKCFVAYVKSQSENNYDALMEACLATKRAIDRLPFDYQTMSKLRYAKTWSIKNSYEVYAASRDAVLTMDETTKDYIPQLYQVYDMQGFLQEYARSLMRYTIEDENHVYLTKLPMIKRLPWVVLIFGCILFLGVFSFANLMYKTLISPIVDLVALSKKIASNDFFAEDVVVENQDEMGELVKSFNRMKDVTGQYIMTLEEKRNTLDLLHKEEMEKLEIERRLESTKLELLKNQINPHFLFNTLNVIGGMADLEEAHTTEKMIKAMSNLFRYNLKTPEAEIALSQEIRVAKDYMYLQQMRFGSRISCQITCDLDMDSVIVPTFLFQPLVENAIIHGICKKEEGGKVLIRIWRKVDNLMITVADTGIGISEEDLNSLRSAFVCGDTQRMGIGLGNIYKRVHAMYQNGEVEIFSKKDKGTVVRIKIPQRGWKEERENA